jgi:hypothetical protein
MTIASKTYKRTRTIYVIGDVAFVANPTTRSSWWKTHAAVAVAECPTCKAPAQSALAERQVDLVSYERVVVDMNKRSHDGFLSQTVAIVEVLRDATRVECERLQAEATGLASACQKLEPASTSPTTSDPETTLEP